jgi:hypothetical protein
VVCHDSEECTAKGRVVGSKVEQNTKLLSYNYKCIINNLELHSV